MNSQGGFFSQVGTALKTPFSGSMSWAQLGVVVLFILTVALAWRQVVVLIANEA